MNKVKLASELVKIAKALVAVHSPEAQDVIESLKPVRQALLSLRLAMRETGSVGGGADADAVWLELNEMLSKFESKLKKY